MDKVILDFETPQNATPKDIFNALLDKRYFFQFLIQNKGKRIVLKMETDKRTSEKQRMYNYLNGVLIPFVTKLRRESGEATDAGDTMIFLKCMFAKDIVTNSNGETLLVLLSQSDMTKDRLLEFIRDIIIFTEQTFGESAPDSQEYKLKKIESLTKRKFKKV